jgi:hypothetical protein
LLAALPVHRIRQAGLLPALLALAGEAGPGAPEQSLPDPDRIDAMTAEDLVRMALDGGAE